MAEFVGIMLGDGGISSRQLSITLHSVDDQEYGRFVAKLVEELFKVPVKVRRKNIGHANDYIVSRVGVTNFCVEKLGLVRGHKIRGDAQVPLWIKNKSHLAVGCLRGLIDTDGSVFTHTYRVKGKVYSYKKLNFTSRSPLLLSFVYETMRTLNLNPRVGLSQICLDSRRDLGRYMTIVGTNNPKHLKRYKK